MAKWALTENPKKSIDIFMEHGDNVIDLGAIGKTTKNFKDNTAIHNALSEISEFLTPGDIVITTEGCCIAQGYQGEGDN
jgi:hypothetical protein